MENKIFSTEKIFITNKRVTVGGITYPLEKIRSVETTSSDRRWIWMVALVAAAIAFVFRFWIMGVFFLALTAILFILFHRTYHVHLSTHTGEQDVLSSRDKEDVATIVAQIKEALRNV